MKGNFYVIIAPSGSGKTAIVNAVTTNRGITTTSRKPREGELDKVDYYFVTKSKFEELIEKGLLIEWAKYGKEGNVQYYGLTKEEFNKRLEMGDLFVICTIEGVNHYKEVYPDTIVVYIDSTFEDIQKQLQIRGGSTKEINERLSLYKEESKAKKIADCIIENRFGALEETVESFKSYIESNRREKAKK